MKSKRILGRMLAKELTPEELAQVSGSDTVVVASRDALAAGSGDEGDTSPPLSTLLATLPDYHEDR
jgi:hypothetical protein